MAFISKYDLRFLTLMGRKYDKNFDFFDDYILYLYYNVFKMNDKKYYHQLEKDLEEYVVIQNGKERDKRGRLHGRKEKKEII